MNTCEAFEMGKANRGSEPKVFDWDKAAYIIAERNPIVVGAGLREDGSATCDAIWLNGKPLKNSQPYLASTWATPVVRVGDDFVECWKMQSDVPRWGERTVWPKSALEIINTYFNTHWEADSFKGSDC